MLEELLDDKLLILSEESTYYCNRNTSHSAIDISLVEYQNRIANNVQYYN